MPNTYYSIAKSSKCSRHTGKDEWSQSTQLSSPKAAGTAHLFSEAFQDVLDEATDEEMALHIQADTLEMMKSWLSRSTCCNYICSLVWFTLGIFDRNIVSLLSTDFLTTLKVAEEKDNANVTWVGLGSCFEVE